MRYQPLFHRLIIDNNSVQHFCSLFLPPFKLKKKRKVHQTRLPARQNQYESRILMLMTGLPYMNKALLM